MNKRNYRLQGILAVLLAAFIITSCDSSDSISGIEDSLSSVPNLTLIEGADNVSLTVNKDKNRSNFLVRVEGMDESAGIEEGTYPSFCALWDVPINSSNSNYDGVKLYDISNEPYWNKVNYIVGNLDNLYEEIEGLNWLEVQIAMWSVMEHKKFDLNTIEHDDLPRDVREGTYSMDRIDKVLDDVMTNYRDFNPETAPYVAFYSQIEGGGENRNVQDQIIIVPGPGDIEKGFGVRHRNFRASANAQELFLGVGDLGSGDNRVDADVDWVQNGKTEVSFSYDPSEDKLIATAGSAMLEYTNLSENMPLSCQLADVDRAQLSILARDEGTSVKLSAELDGIILSEIAENGTANETISLFIQNIDISSGFMLEGTVEINGSFGQSQELSRIELNFGCPAPMAI